jgi:hypothetical protein
MFLRKKILSTVFTVFLVFALYPAPSFADVPEVADREGESFAAEDARDYMPGEVLVVFREDVSESAAKRGLDAERVQFIPVPAEVIVTVPAELARAISSSFKRHLRLHSAHCSAPDAISPHQLSSDSRASCSKTASICLINCSLSGI